MSLLDTACTELGRPAIKLKAGFDPALEVVHETLTVCTHRLRASEGREADRLASVVTALREVREDVRSARFQRRADGHAVVIGLLGDLEQLETPRELIDAACGKLRRAGVFDRVVFSCVEGARWVPRRLSLRGIEDQPDRCARTYGEGWLRLQRALPEAEAVRLQQPVLITDREGPSNGPAILDGLDGVDHVIAPVRAAGRVLGLIHADRHASGEGVDSLDRDLVWEFAEAFGPVADRAVVRAYVKARRADIQERIVRVSGLLEELAEVEMHFPVAHRIPPGQQGGSASGSDLTRREREVLALMARGASNREIGETLYVAVGTVKGHVRNILRKLGAANRAEAVSWHLRQQVAGLSVDGGTGGPSAAPAGKR